MRNQKNSNLKKERNLTKTFKKKLSNPKLLNSSVGIQENGKLINFYYFEHILLTLFFIDWQLIIYFVSSVTAIWSVLGM